MEKRNISIDLVRIISTFMIFVLHTLLGGALNYKTGVSAFITMWYLEFLCLTSVNIFALISGYFGWSKKTNWKKILQMWIEVIIFALVGFIICTACGLTSFTFKDLLSCLMPVTFKQFWYFNAYLVVCFISPFLNAGLQKIEKETLKKMLIIGGILIGIMSPISSADTFSMALGYNGLWLSYMYLVGAYLNKYRNDEECRKKRFLHLICALVSPLLTTLLFFVLINNGLNEYATKMTGYTFLLTVIGSISLFQFLSTLTPKNKAICKIISIISPVTFWMYILHCQSQIFNNVVLKLANSMVNINTPFSIVITVMLTASIIFIVTFIVATVIHKIYTKTYNLLTAKKSK